MEPYRWVIWGILIICNAIVDTDELGGRRRVVEARTTTQVESKLSRGLRLAAEVFLILVIVGLLVAIWLPAWIGPHLGIGPHS